MIVLLILVFDWMLVICKKELSVKNVTVLSTDLRRILLTVEKDSSIKNRNGLIKGAVRWHKDALGSEDSINWWFG